MENSLGAFVRKKYGKDLAACQNEEIYHALMEMLQKHSGGVARRIPARKLYYISAEFLLGKLLSNNLINAGLFDSVRAELAAAGKELSEIEEFEPEPSLGNGGLGRLAACYLDSVASLGLPGDGIGLNYHFGLFRQKFADNRQTEIPDPWLREDARSWLTPAGLSFSVPFGRFSVRSALYDINVIGYGGFVNKLHLFDLEKIDEALVGQGIAFDKADVRHNLTLFLYPDDSDEAGRLLRVYQQYFMVSSAAQYILWEMEKAGRGPRSLHRHAVVQINDTHPSLIIPELIRLLLDRGLSMDEAVRVVSKTCAYTNHTILAEALEKWPIAYLEEAVPHLTPIIRELNRRAKKRCADESVSIIDEAGRVHMAHMDIHYGFSVNGVAALHTDILKEHELNRFYRLYPEKFTNKTNGVTFRRWLMHCNPGLSALLDELVGVEWRADARRLSKLDEYAGDPAVLDRLTRIKTENKIALREYLSVQRGAAVDENSIFDVQIKRLHAYKRQQLNALYLIYKYKQIKAGILPPTPITAVFGAKAAPSYTLAKDIIHLILCLEKLVNADPQVSPHLMIVFVENYNVTVAEKLIPASDISEQISLASKEASGTGNMKLMLNGAVTLGTMDGANVEIAQIVGGENIYIFGRSSEEVIDLYEKKAYRPSDYYNSDPRTEELVDFIVSKPLLRIGDPESLCRLYVDLLREDWFMTLLDLQDYIAVKEKILEDYQDRSAWANKMLRNIAGAGYFSSDRAISEYNRDIWRL
ncbi:MAG: glycogen/starch/alpha-glucan family phosphorylase [Clostridiales Family XIII bacterium]|jgi:starch phosphorylase|nr:glycogen/starch/alpha-glucan family phosphorylase [Clostridiales Family XIII bacterium]